MKASQDFWYAVGAFLAGLVAAFMGGRKAGQRQRQELPPPATPTLEPPPAADGPAVIENDVDPVAGDQPGRWFSWRELDRFDEAPAPVRAELRRLVREVLDPLRDEVRRPVHVTLNGGFNGPSTDAWYKQQGRTLRSSGSYHRKGQAADIVVDGMRPQDVADLLRKMRAEGKVNFGPARPYKAEGYTHVDLGPERSW